MMKNNVYTVGQINTYIKNMFKQDFFLQRVYVKGEVSNCKYHGSGHIYFTIKDEKGALAAIMFRGSRSGLGFNMKDGDKVICFGSIEVYEGAGKYQLYAREIILDGAGDLYQEYERLKKELFEMGMFDESFKQPIPKYARTIGVVTAATGAAIQDIRNISSRRNPYVQLVLYPAQVQGEGAIESICRGINALDNYGVDVMIVGRGGGSIEDLWAFNSEEVARAIFNCRTPVISAVGHETDTTIADYVADLRAPTPSAAAELAVCDILELQSQIDGYAERLTRELRTRIDFARHRAEKCRLLLDKYSPHSRLREQQTRLAELEGRLEVAMERILTNSRHTLAVYAQRLEGNSPLRHLSSGYSYVSDSAGRNIHSARAVSAGDEVGIRFTDGSARAQIIDITIEDE